MDSGTENFSTLDVREKGPDANALLKCLLEKRGAQGAELGAGESDGCWERAIRLDERIRSLSALLEAKEKRCDELENELRKSQWKPAKFPDDMYEMAAFLRRAPSAWHLHTMVEMIVRHTNSVKRRGNSDCRSREALHALAEMALKFRLTPKTRTPQWLREAIKEPAFLEVWNRPQPKRKRGDAAGNETQRVISIFVEQAMLSYDKRVEWDNECKRLPDDGPSRKERYSDVEGYLKGFLPFAKEQWENGGRAQTEALFDYLEPDILKSRPELLEPARLRKALPNLRASERVWLVLQVLGGLSKCEIFRLNWESFDFAAGLIKLDSPGTWRHGIQCVAMLTPEMEKWLKPFAKRKGEVTDLFGKSRTNVGKVDDVPKRSFGLFKKDIEKRAKAFLESWRGAWPP